MLCNDCIIFCNNAATASDRSPLQITLCTLSYCLDMLFLHRRALLEQQKITLELSSLNSVHAGEELHGLRFRH